MNTVTSNVFSGDVTGTTGPGRRPGQSIAASSVRWRTAATGWLQLMELKQNVSVRKFSLLDICVRGEEDLTMSTGNGPVASCTIARMQEKKYPSHLHHIRFGSLACLVTSDIEATTTDEEYELNYFVLGHCLTLHQILYLIIQTYVMTNGSFVLY
uniref:Uncharacterized protein n=1 Tax=Anopheles culicifacies TaxID=139723 RepID=A0A182MPL1_9DIPT